MSFNLELPTKEAVSQETLQETVISKEMSVAISDYSKEKVEEIMNADIGDFKERKELASAFEQYGAEIITKSAQKNNLLKTRIGDLSKAGGETGTVAKGLENLSIQMKDLDPSGIDFMKSSPLSKLFNPARAYFNKYKTADKAIGEIIESLEEGVKILTDDNVTLEIEQASLKDLTKQLNEKISMGEEMDVYLTRKLEEAKVQNIDPERIKFIEEEILFPLRQKLMDFNQMLVVNQNGIISMEIIRKNNLELIRGVKRAQTVTVSALTTAVTVAGALYNQKIVLEKVQMVNKTTNQMISATSKMLKEQGVAIQEESMNTALDIETLKKAFSETLSALDDISVYKQNALPQMKQMIEEFRTMAETAEKQIQKMED